MTETPGQVVDAEIAVLKARIAAVEAAGKLDYAKAVAWAKANWAHIVLTWPAAVSVLAPFVKAALKL